MIISSLLSGDRPPSFWTFFLTFFVNFPHPFLILFYWLYFVSFSSFLFSVPGLVSTLPLFSSADNFKIPLFSHSPSLLHAVDHFVPLHPSSCLSLLFISSSSQDIYFLVVKLQSFKFRAFFVTNKLIFGLTLAFRWCSVSLTYKYVGANGAKYINSKLFLWTAKCSCQSKRQDNKTDSFCCLFKINQTNFNQTLFGESSSRSAKIALHNTFQLSFQH